MGRVRLLREKEVGESQGLAMQDVAVGTRVLERAPAGNVGRQIEFGA